MTVRGIIDQLDLDTHEYGKTYEYKVKNLCTSAAIYKRKPANIGKEDETLKAVQDKSPNFPNLKDKELQKLVGIALQG